MEQTYTNCKLAGQQGCPHHNHPFMLALIRGAQKTPGKPVTTIPNTVDDNANSLCVKCPEFSPKHQD